MATEAEMPLLSQARALASTGAVSAAEQAGSSSNSSNSHSPAENLQQTRHEDGHEPHARQLADDPENDPDSVLMQLVAMGFDMDVCLTAIAECVANRNDSPDSRSLMDAALGWVLPTPTRAPAQVKAKAAVATTPASVSAASSEQRHEPPLARKSILKNPTQPLPQRHSSFPRWFSAKLDQAAHAFESTLSKMKGHAASHETLPSTPRTTHSASSPTSEDSSSPRSTVSISPVRQENTNLSIAPESRTFVISSSHDSLNSLVKSSESSGDEITSKPMKVLRFSTAPDELINPPRKSALKSSEKTSASVHIEPVARVEYEESEDTIPTDTVYKMYHRKCKLHHETPVHILLEQIRESMKIGDPQMMTEIDLSGVSINSNNVKSISDFLNLDFGLKKLILADCHLEDKILQRILNSLLAANTVTWLSLAKNTRIKSSGLKYIGVFIKKSKTLEYLDISGIQLDRSGASHIGHGLGHVLHHTVNSASLKVLIMESCRVRSDAIKAMVPGIRLSNLKQLNLRGNKMPFDCAPHLASMISSRSQASSQQHTRQLQHLDLSQNELRHGMTEICSALAHADVLTHINLQENKLDSSSLLAISDALRINKTLQSLDISMNKLDTVHFKEYAKSTLKEALIINTSLRSLSLADTGIGSDAAIALAEALPLNQGLERLNLKENVFDLGGVMAIVAAMKLNLHIAVVELVPVLGVGRSHQTELAKCLNDIDIYCRRNKGIKTSHDAGHNVENLNDSPHNEKSLSHRRETTAGSLESFTSSHGPQDHHHHYHHGQGVTLDEDFDNMIVLSTHTASDGKLSALDKFKIELVATEQSVLLLDEMIAGFKTQMNEASKSSGDSSSRSTRVKLDDISKQLYKDCRKFKSKIQKVLGHGLVEDEETLMTILSLNDRLETSISSFEELKKSSSSSSRSKKKKSSKRRHKSVLNPEPELELPSSESESESASPSSSSSPSPVPSQSPSASPSKSTAESQRHIFTTVSQAPATLSVEASSSSSKQTISSLHHRTIKTHSSHSRTVSNESFTPMVPATQVHISTPISEVPVPSVLSPPPQHLTVKENEEGGRKLGAGGLSFTSFEELDHEHDDVKYVGMTKLMGNLKVKEPMGDDAFMAELDDQMKEIDEFLNSAVSNKNV